MKASEIRQKYLDFFVKRGHKIIQPTSLVPENDPTTLFTSCGMQPLVPYLKGETHPMGKRLVDSQPSIRLQDIEEVGDTCHTTFFEMLGNWSLGDYFKKEQLGWFLEFLTKELRLAKEKLWVSVFEGTKDVPRDEKSFKIWQDLGIAKDHIFFYGPEKNWWSRSGTPEQMPAGEIGGPDSEVFFDFGDQPQKTTSFEAKTHKCHPNCQCGRFLEIGNSVFMQYEKKVDGKLVELPNKNVDFGGGLERLAAATSNDQDIFKIDLFSSIIQIIELLSSKSYQENQKSMRIIADHLRAAVFLISQGVEPSNTQQGYVLRRLIRRAVRYGKLLGIKDNFISQMIKPIIKSYEDFYPELNESLEKIETILGTEENKFSKSLKEGLKFLQKELQGYQIFEEEAKKGNKNILYHGGRVAFDLHQTYGFPPEMTLEELKKIKNISTMGDDIYWEGYRKKLADHQDLSRTASAGMFKGGLADHSEEVTKLHTATHLLHASLRKILGEHVGQKGSNVTAERLRFDFSHPQKMTSEELQKAEAMVNEQIKANLPVTMEIMDLERAQKSGALGFFKEKYNEKVKVYKMGDFSAEICGGPHVDFTGKLERFKIIKEEAAGAGVRRIYGVIHPE